MLVIENIGEVVVLIVVVLSVVAERFFKIRVRVQSRKFVVFYSLVVVGVVVVIVVVGVVVDGVVVLSRVSGIFEDADFNYLSEFTA